MLGFKVRLSFTSHYRRSEEVAVLCCVDCENVRTTSLNGRAAACAHGSRHFLLNGIVDASLQLMLFT